MSRANVADLVEAAARRSPDRLALTGPGGTWTWGRLAEQVRRLAGGLAALGLTPGDRLALLLGNSPEFVLGYFAALRAGLIVVPINTGYTGPELSHQLADSATRAVLVAPQLRGRVADLQPALPALGPVISVGGCQWSELLSTPPAPDRPDRGGEDIAVLLYTSGTSGRPKGAMLSHRALLANLEQVPPRDPPVLTSRDVVLLVIPLFHIYGLNAGLGLVARHAATAVLLDRFDPLASLAAVHQYQVTVIVGAPPVYVAWSDLPEVAGALGRVRLAVSGASSLPPPVLAGIRERTGRTIYEGYGLTETAPVLTSTLAADPARPGSVGRPVPGVDLRLLDGAGDPVEDGDPGEIAVRGPNLFSGYWPDGAGGPDEQGWFRTGDVGYLGPEGDLFLVDRRREVVMVSGFNVYPREVEEVLLTHPAVQEAAVVGVPHAHTGESVRALVVLRPGHEVSAVELTEHASRSLARFKCPTAVEFVAALPHSATGKVSKGRLREGMADLTPSSPGAPDDGRPGVSGGTSGTRGGARHTGERR